MSELEQKIAAWRERLMQALPGEEATVRELESHLRDHLESLLRRGVAPAEALAASVQRLGEVPGIAREFARLRSRWLSATAVMRAVLGLLAVLVAMVAVLMGAHYSVGTMTPLLAVHVFSLTAGYLAVLATGLLGMWALATLWRRPLCECDRQALRQTIFRLTVANCVVVPLGIGLGMVWAAENRGRVWAWEHVEIAALLVAFSTFLLLLGHFSAKFDDRARWILAVLGGTTVTVGLLNAKGLSATVAFGWLLIALLAAQAIVVLLRPANAKRVKWE